MSVTYCHHSFTMIKSDTTLMLWTCGMCHSGPHWFIFECKYCKLKTCRPVMFPGYTSSFRSRGTKDIDSVHTMLDMCNLSAYARDEGRWHKT